jgi:hypothetical protein
METDKNDRRTRVEKNGKVAVLVSPSFGAGWSTWCTKEGEAAVFCPEIVEALMAGRSGQEIIEIATRLFPGAYTAGLWGVRIEWVDKGVRFEISEYDGAEEVRILGPNTGYVA